jgi:hypothetical protein
MVRVCNPDRSPAGINFRSAPRFDATGAILTRLFGGFAPDVPHYISGKEFKKWKPLLFMIWIHKYPLLLADKWARKLRGIENCHHKIPAWNTP